MVEVFVIWVHIFISDVIFMIISFPIGCWCNLNVLVCVFVLNNKTFFIWCFLRDINYFFLFPLNLSLVVFICSGRILKYFLYFVHSFVNLTLKCCHYLLMNINLISIIFIRLRNICWIFFWGFPLKFFVTNVSISFRFSFKETLIFVYGILIDFFIRTIIYKRNSHTFQVSILSLFKNFHYLNAEWLMFS